MLVECPKCKLEMQHSDLLCILTFAGNREEPAEYESQCRHCGYTGEFETVEEILCTTCKDVRVKDEGDQCGECYTCKQEELADAAKYHD